MKHHSLYYDKTCREQLLKITASAAKQTDDAWNSLKSTLLSLCRTNSRTPTLDAAFLEGILEALSARRTIDTAGEHP